MKKFSMRVVLIISVLFITFGSANVSIAQERDTANKLPEVELGSLDTSNIIAEEVAQEKPAEVENLEEVPTTDELMQNPEVLEQPVADSDDPDLTVVNSGAYWTIYRNTVNKEYSLRMFGNVPSSKPSAWNSYLKYIKHIEIEEATLTGSFEAYFRDNVFTVLESVRIEQCNLSGVTSFRSAFEGQLALGKVIIRDNYYPETPFLTNIKRMFASCSKISELDVSGLNTSSVTNMYAAFSNTNSLKELDISNFDTSSVTDMSYMFSYCTSLEELDLSTFDTSSVTNMYCMLNGLHLKKLDVSNFDTSSVTNMQLMFGGCKSLEELDVSTFDTSSVTNMRGVFAECNSLGELDLSTFDTSSATTMQIMFYDCTSLEELDLSTFDTSSVTNMDMMFQECTALKFLYLDNFTDAPSMTDMFKGTTSLTYLFASHNLSTFNRLENTSWYDEKNWVQFS
ncbi:TPA: BspA family leucine-rich repeat surface protein, partial [Listeria monocytogenes]|nr:BspA family leucine-rich repeat surface protein [Listeria monocytogenes]